MTTDEKVQEINREIREHQEQTKTLRYKIKAQQARLHTEREIIAKLKWLRRVLIWNAMNEKEQQKKGGR